MNLSPQTQTTEQLGHPVPDDFLSTHFTQIEALPHLDAEYKAWAKKDLESRIGGIEIDLMKKYEFYDQMAALREDILKNVPEKNRPALYKIINDILNNPTQGQGRDTKAMSLKKIASICHEYTKNKSLLRFLAERHKNGYESQVYQVLNEGDRPKYEKNYEKVFTPGFWGLWNQDPFSHGEFPQLRNAFFYLNPEQFHAETTLEEVKKISEGFLGAIAYEASDLIDNLPIDQQKPLLKEFKSFQPKDLAKALKKLLLIKSKENKENQALLVAKMDIKNLLRLKSIKEAEKKLKAMKSIYGNDFGNNLENDIQTEFEKEIEYEKEHAKSLQKDHETPADKKNRLLQDIRTNLFYPTLASLALAQKNAEKLKKIDASASRNQLEKIKTLTAKLIQKSEAPADSKENSDIGVDKQIKIRFIDKCIEHAQKTKEAAAQLGIPTNDPKYWSAEGCRNRSGWLKDNNKWGDYKKRNSGDKNIPSQKTGSMHYRWLDLRTGSNLSAGKAEQGIKYLQRYKESGYYLAAYGGGFSTDWSPGGSTHDPDQFISKCNEEKGKIMSQK